MTTALSSSSKKGGEADTQTLKQLKVNLKDALRRSGVLDSVKAQIRKEFIGGLTGQLPVKANSHADGKLDLRERLSLSVIYHFLRHRNFTHALSVFAAECGLDSKAAWLSEIDIVRSLQFGTQTEIYKAVSEKENQSNDTDDTSLQSGQSVFDALLSHLSSDIGRGTVTEISVQTDDATNIRGPRESLEHQMQNLRKSYICRRDAERAAPTKSIEEKMIQFQRECEERYRRDSESYVNYMKETEISKVRLEESLKARAESEILRKELEGDYQRRLQDHAERESSSNRAFSDRDRQMQQSQYEARQQMQREIDDLRGREKSGIRKLELESQGLQMLELRLKEAKAVIESRERECSRKEKQTQDLFTDSVEKAKLEARSYMRSEMEDLNHERSGLRIEKQRLEDLRSSQEMMVESANSSRQLLREAQAELLVREDEVEVLQKKLYALNDKLSRFPDDWEVEEENPRTGKVGRSLVSMLRERNMQLEATLVVERNSEKQAEVERRVKESEMALAGDSLKMKEAMTRSKQSLISANKENDNLRAVLEAERTALVAAKFKNEEMSRLLKDQKNTIESLLKSQANVSRSQGLKSSMEDLNTFFANRKKRDSLPYPPMGSSASPTYGPYSPGPTPFFKPQGRSDGYQQAPAGSHGFPNQSYPNQSQPQPQWDPKQQSYQHQQQYPNQGFETLPSYTNASTVPVFQVPSTIPPSVPARNTFPHNIPTANVPSHLIQAPARDSNFPTQTTSHRYPTIPLEDSPTTTPTHNAVSLSQKTDFYDSIDSLQEGSKVNVLSAIKLSAASNYLEGNTERERENEKKRAKEREKADERERENGREREIERMNKSERDRENERERETIKREAERAKEEVLRASMEMERMKNEMEKHRLEMEQKEENWVRERLLMKEKLEREELKIEEEKVRELEELEEAAKANEIRNEEIRKDLEDKRRREDEVNIIKMKEKEVHDETLRAEEKRVTDRQLELLSQKDLADEKGESQELSKAVVKDSVTLTEAEGKNESDSPASTSQRIIPPTELTALVPLVAENHSSSPDRKLEAVAVDKEDLSLARNSNAEEMKNDTQIDLVKMNLLKKENPVPNTINVSNIERGDGDSVDSSFLATDSKDQTGGGENGVIFGNLPSGKSVFDAILENCGDDGDWPDDEESFDEDEGDNIAAKSQDQQKEGEEEESKEALTAKKEAEQAATEVQKKKDADNKAIQEARASVIARRKQKLDREESVAIFSTISGSSGLSDPNTVSVPSKSTKSVSIQPVKTDIAESPKYASSSSSDNTPEVQNKSKSVIGLFEEESMEIESDLEGAEASGDSSGSSSW